MGKVEHKKLNLEVQLGPITQRTLEQFYADLREQGVKATAVSLPEYAGAVLRKAIELGWLNGAEFDAFTPAQVIYLYRAVAEEISQAIAIPPE